MNPRPSRRRRVFVEDSRRNGNYLRTTWHPENRTFVVSIWDDTVCTAAVRVPVERSPELIGLLVDGLSDAASNSAASTSTAATTTPAPSAKAGPVDSFRAQLHAWTRWAAAQARKLISRRDPGKAVPMPSTAEPPEQRQNGSRRTA